MRYRLTIQDKKTLCVYNTNYTNKRIANHYASLFRKHGFRVIIETIGG